VVSPGGESTEDQQEKNNEQNEVHERLFGEGESVGRF
jgi:hypothetical protein